MVPVLRTVCGETMVDFSRSEMRGTFWNGSEVFLRSAPDAAHVQRLRGPSRAWFWMEEAAYLADGLQCFQILLATLREHGRMGQAWLTTTPRGKGWIHDLFKLTTDPDYRLFTASTDSNEFTSDKYKQVLRASYGVGWFARQELDGEFCDPEGSLFQRNWFQVVDAAPGFTRLYRGWDLAVSTKSSADYTVGVLVGVTADQDLYVLDVVRGRWEWPDAKRIIIQTARADGPGTTICVESVAFQLAAVQELRREAALAQHVTVEIRADRDKLSHALPIASRAQAGKVFLRRGQWVAAFLDEFCAFTGDGKTHDDQVDGTTIAYRGASRAGVCLRIL